jgi:hypothetical protein
MVTKVSEETTASIFTVEVISLKKIIARKLLKIHIGTKNLQNCCRNQFAVVVPRRASVKVSTSVGVEVISTLWIAAVGSILILSVFY